MEMFLINSAVVHFAGYDEKQARLRLRFRDSGWTYDYFMVPKSIFVALRAARSCGRFFNDHIKDRYRDGGVVCGTSAGAAALSRLTMAGGEIDREGNLVAQYIGPGLGLLGYDAIIDTHFSQRRRLQRLFFVVAGNTELLGVGIDEDTALIVRGDVGEVVGAGGVTFVDGRDTVRFDNADDLDTGRQLTLSHLRVGIVGVPLLACLLLLYLGLSWLTTWERNKAVVKLYDYVFPTTEDAPPLTPVAGAEVLRALGVFCTRTREPQAALEYFQGAIG